MGRGAATEEQPIASRSAVGRRLEIPRETVIETWERHRRQVTPAARELGINEKTLKRWLADWGFETSRAIPRERVLETWERHKRRVAPAARELGVNVKTLHRWLADYGVDKRPWEIEVTGEQIAETYRQTRSVHKTAEMLGIAAVTVRRKLDEQGIEREDHRLWTAAELEHLEDVYARYRDEGRLGDLAEDMGRDLSWIKLKARDLGLTNGGQQLWKQRWMAMSDDELRDLLKRFAESELGVARWCESEGIPVNGFIRAMRTRFAAEYDNLVMRGWTGWGAEFKNGWNLEISIGNQLQKMGFYCYPSIRSKGPADLFIVGPKGQKYVIQSKLNGKLAPAEWNRVLEHAQLLDATPILAGKPGTELRFWRMTGPKVEGEKHHRQPLEPVEFTDDGELQVVAGV